MLLVTMLTMPSAFGADAPQSPVFEAPAPAVATAVDGATQQTLSGSPTVDAGLIDAAKSASTMEALDDSHRLAIGDVLSFRILEDEEETVRLMVTDSGDLDVPYIGRFPAKAKTCKALARELKAQLEKEYYYQATVVVAVDQMARSRGKIYLVGPVRVPGPQDIPSDEVLTVSKAILRAGGFLETADKKNVRITRKGEGDSAADTSFEVNLVDILEKGKREGDIVLQPGDLIYIPERLIRF